jgi:hypothetical protein
MKFEKFNDDLWIAKGKIFVAILQKDYTSYTIFNNMDEVLTFKLTIRKINGEYKEEFGFFLDEETVLNSNRDGKYILEHIQKIYIPISVIDRKIYNAFSEVIVRAEKLIDALGYD